MKKNRIAIVLLVSIFICSCNEKEFLNEVPNAISTESFFNSSADFEQGVNACYAGLRAVYSGAFAGSFMLMGELRSDNTTVEVTTLNAALAWMYDIDKFIENEGNPHLLETWNNAYTAIGICNNLLYYIDTKGEGVDGIDRYKAEAKFIRALLYYHVAMYWGNVPLVTTKVNTMAEAFELNKQVSREVVYEQIVSDLNEAKANLPESYDAGNRGRATSGAAMTLLAEVLMWQNKYTEAEAELVAVVNSNKYQVLDDYSSVFSVNNELNDEIIFACQFYGGAPYIHGSNHMYTYSPSTSDRLPFAQDNITTGMNMPTQSLIESFEEDDIRLGMIDTTFIDDNMGDDFRGSIVPFTKKYWDPNHEVRFVTGSDVPIYRYPHVLLMLAECYLNSGAGDPLPLVNQVRQRAGLPDLSDASLEDIIQERRMEFHCENDRWGVLVRTGKVLEVMTAHGIEQKQQRVSYRSPAFDNIKIFFPIPGNVISVDPTMQQNP